MFFGYDDAASAAILGKLPGMAILYSAHGKYNDDDFPCRTMSSRVYLYLRQLSKQSFGYLVWPAT